MNDPLPTARLSQFGSIDLRETGNWRSGCLELFLLWWLSIRDRSEIRAWQLQSLAMMPPVALNGKSHEGPGIFINDERQLW